MAALLSPHLADAQAMERLTNKAKELLAPVTGKTDDRLEEVAKFDHQVAGVTVSEDGRIFVNFSALVGRCAGTGRGSEAGRLDRALSERRMECLVQIDLKTNAVKRIYPFDPEVAGPASYLKDVRIAPDAPLLFHRFRVTGSPRRS